MICKDDRRTLRGLILCLSTASCFLHTAFRTGDFPEVTGPHTVPLVDPLTSLHAVIRLRASNTDARSIVVPMIIDSGAWRTMLPRDAVDALGLETSTTDKIRLVDIGGTKRDFVGSTLPRLYIGTLEIRDLPIGVLATEDDEGVLGHDVLSRYGFEIDFDAGSFVLGAPRIEASLELPLTYSAESDLPVVGVTIEREEVSLLVDTGAQMTALDQDWADGAGVPKRRTDKTERMRGVHSTVRANFRYDLHTMEAGGIPLPDVSAAPMLERVESSGSYRELVGLLGMDALRHYVIRIGADRMQLRRRERGDQAEAELRVMRWPWVPNCPGQVACLRVSMERLPSARGEPPDVRVTIEALKGLRNNARVLLGFVGTDGRLLSGFPMLDWTVGALQTGEGARFALGHEPDAAWIISRVVQEESPVASIAVIDVNPGSGDRGIRLLSPAQ